MQHRHWMPLIMLGTMSCSVSAWAQEVPVYLETARTLLNDVSPENNDYRYHGWIKIKGDKTLFGTVDTDEVHIDCSGLVDALLQRTAPTVMQVLQHQHWRSYPKAENYYAAIAANDGFILRKTMDEVEAGDIFAAKFVNDKDTGHVMLVDARPRLIEKPIAPFVADTQQWEVVVIDSSSSHGISDTRYRKNGPKQSGIGRGSVRVYTDSTGQPIGWVMTMAPRSQFRSSGLLAIGKPVF